MVEIIYEVDKEDNIIGKRPKPEFFNSNFIHRASHLLVFNKKGEMLIQLRVKDKPLYPGVWDTAVGGTVAEESYEVCLEREMQEEIGISVKYRHLFKCYCSDDVDKSFKEIYSAVHDGPFTMQETEVADLKWISLKELKDWMEEKPEEFTPPFVDCMKIYFQKYGVRYQNDDDNYIVTEVDKDDNVMGSRHILEFPDSDRIHRGALVLIFNSENNILLQRKAKDCLLYPGTWDFSAAGFVDEGESYEQAAVRETKEELGIKIDVKRILHHFWFSKEDKAHLDLFKAKYDSDVSISHDVQDTRWIALEDLKQEIDQTPENFSEPFVAVMKAFFNRQQ